MVYRYAMMPERTRIMHHVETWRTCEGLCPLDWKYVPCVGAASSFDVGPLCPLCWCRPLDTIISYHTDPISHDMKLVSTFDCGCTRPSQECKFE